MRRGSPPSLPVRGAFRRGRWSAPGPDPQATSGRCRFSGGERPRAVADNAATISAHRARVAEIEALDRPAALASRVERPIERGEPASVVWAERVVIEPLDGNSARKIAPPRR